MVSEIMEAYASNYFTLGTSEAIRKLHFPNITMQQEREYKAQQKTFHIAFEMSVLTETR